MFGLCIERQNWRRKKLHCFAIGTPTRKKRTIKCPLALCVYACVYIYKFKCTTMFKQAKQRRKKYCRLCLCGLWEIIQIEFFRLFLLLVNKQARKSCKEMKIYKKFREVPLKRLKMEHFHYVIESFFFLKLIFLLKRMHRFFLRMLQLLLKGVRKPLGF